MAKKKKPTPSEGPRPVTDIRTLGKAFVEGMREAAAEAAKLPKKFKRGEGIKFPLAD